MSGATFTITRTQLEVLERNIEGGIKALEAASSEREALLTAVKEMVEALERISMCTTVYRVDDADDNRCDKLKANRIARATLAKYQHLMENVK